jgi:SAM-dependent methyltransferase
MTDDESPIFDKFLQRYEDERTPWDDPAPPPEIVALGEELSPGRALDLGCGYGRVAIFLARLGWSVDGIDFIPKAIAVARQRASAVGVSERARFHVASAARLDFLRPPYDLAVDIGCMHSFTEELLRGYQSELARLLRPGGSYVLFAHLSDTDGDGNDDKPHGISEDRIDRLMADDFQLERVEHGIIQVEDRPPWNSGWFWFRRR